MYLVFNSGIGDDVTYEYPMDSLSFFLAGVGFEAQMEFELGDGFVVIWCTFLIIFTIVASDVIPRPDFLRPPVSKTPLGPKINSPRSPGMQ